MVWRKKNELRNKVFGWVFKILKRLEKMAMTDISVRLYDGKPFLFDSWCKGHHKLTEKRSSFRCSRVQIKGVQDN